MRGYLPVQSAWSGDVGDGRKRYMRPVAVRLSGIASAEIRKEFPPDPLAVRCGVTPGVGFFHTPIVHCLLKEKLISLPVKYCV